MRLLSLFLLLCFMSLFIGGCGSAINPRNNDLEEEDSTGTVIVEIR